MFVKLCGFTCQRDAEMLQGLNVSAAGIVFYRGSERFVRPVIAREITSVLKESGIAAAGVFVDDDPDTIKSIADYVGLDMLQVYSMETAKSLRGFLPLISCFRVRPEHDTGDLPAPADGGLILFDTFDEVNMGGTGRSFSSGILSNYGFRNRMIIAGGLNSSNITSIIKNIWPFGVDISSGIEEAPRVKSAEKIKDILEKMKEAENDGTA